MTNSQTVAEGTVKSEIKDGIGTITFFHPQSNSLPGKLLKQLAAEITALGKNVNAKVIVIKSEGEKAFCAGASFDELIQIDNAEKGNEFFSGFAMVINAMRLAPKFVIARVQGKAVGGGVGIVCAADYTIATEAALVKLSELAIGIGPFVVGPAVERKIGTAAFSHLAINATEWKDAQWAKEKGLYAEVVADINTLNEAVNKMATTLSQNNPKAMMMLKEVFWQGTEDWNILLEERAKMSGKLVLSDFTKESIKRFKGK